jgi:Protein-disulfide isomerase
MAGVYISWLLLLKQMHVKSQYADKICSLFKQKDCNNVLESKAAKPFGIIGLSEVGFGYFAANVFLILFSPALISSVVLINIFTLPFTLWSVWYQWAKAKQWCVLCLIVLVLLWLIFIVSCLFGYIRLPGINFQELFNLIAAGCCYFISVLGINILVPKLNTEKATQSLQQSMNSLKANEDVFSALLKKQPFYETSDCDSVICFGNPDSKLRVTVFSNPYCNPCAMMHKRIEDLLIKADNDICVKYILSSFGENLNTTNKYLISACLADKTGSDIHIFSEWFEKGRVLKDEYFKEQSLDMENPAIEVEFQKHEAWKTKNQLRGTPTILVNGYQLPESYKVEDLRYFADFDL